MRTADFDYPLPPDLIAQRPAPERDQSRLMVLHRDSNRIEHRHFWNLPDYLRPGDVLVMNNSRVIPARLRGANAATGGQFEMLLLEENAVNDWWAMVRPGKRARMGTRIKISAKENQRENPNFKWSNLFAEVAGIDSDGRRRLRFKGTPDISETLDAVGEIPLPPYILSDKKNEAEDRERYQTVYARPAGSVAAPTAGLHFTAELLNGIRARGVQVCFVTLHVGAGTFAPVKTDVIAEHAMHEERYELGEETARAVNDAKASKRRVIAVGTTSVRVLESAALDGSASGNGAALQPGAGRTRIFIYPPRDFKIADAMVTNFHLPQSTLLMLAAAFAAPGEQRGREMILSAYAEAVRNRYRFFSYGDAMLIV